MKIKLIRKNQHITFDQTQVKDISIPLKFNGKQPNIYGVKKAESEAYEENGFIGDTRKGGACNFEKITFVPHCNGTHTECIGHISRKRFSIQEQLNHSLLLSTVITVLPENASAVSDSYDPKKESGDFMITVRSLKDALKQVSDNFLEALVIRTLPNDLSKKGRNYSEQKPAFFSVEAMKYIVDLGVGHLLVDLPSVDKSRDEGKLSTHHLFWNIEAGTNQVTPESMTHKTITEMIYVGEDILDGHYLLNLQIAPFVSDAAPSRPLLYPLIEIVDH